MNHPVLLPKRKEFGFLKAPRDKSPFKSSSMSKVAAGSGVRQEFLSSSTHSAKPINFVQSINSLKLKYELKSTHFFDNKKPLETNFDNIKVNRTGAFNTIKFDLKKEHLDRQAYITSTGSNVKNLRRKHHLMNIYSLSDKLPKTASSLTSQKSYRSKSFISCLKEANKREEENIECENDPSRCRNDCLSCKFKKRPKQDQFVSMKNLKKPVDYNLEYERIKTMESMRSTELGTKTPQRRSTEFSDYTRTRSRKSNFTDFQEKMQKTEFDHNFYDDDDDDDIIPKLTLWLV